MLEMHYAGKMQNMTLQQRQISLSWNILPQNDKRYSRQGSTYHSKMI